MNLTGIIAIAGKPGLYRVVSRTKSGLLVESLLDGKKMTALATHKISSLEDISMYTYDEDVKLSEVMQKIYDHTKGGETIDPKVEGGKLFEYFGAVMPDFDQERVYPSDVKKLFTWYNLLLNAGVLKPEEAEKGASAIEDAEIIEETRNEE
jgi:hypothetical protein